MSGINIYTSGWKKTGRNVSVPQYEMTIRVDVGNLVNNSKVYFTVKNKEDDVDSAAMIMVEKTDGLKYINGTVAEIPGNASLTINDVPTGDITISIAAVELAKLGVGSYRYDVQIVRSVGAPVTTLAKGAFVVNDDITRAVA